MKRRGLEEGEEERGVAEECGEETTTREDRGVRE